MTAVNIVFHLRVKYTNKWRITKKKEGREKKEHGNENGGNGDGKSEGNW